MKSSFTCSNAASGVAYPLLILKCHRVAAPMAFFVLVWLLLPMGLKSQPLSGSTPSSGTEWPATLRYRQELNNYLWQLDAGRTFALTPRLQGQFSEQFRTSMLRLSSNEDKWKDEHAFFTRFGYQLWPSLQLNTLLRSLSFYDRQTGLYNDVRSHAAGLGLRFTPSRRVRLAAAAGPKWDSRMRFHDRGFFFSGEEELSGLEWGGYAHHLQGMLETDRYAVRKNHESSLAYAVARVFTPGSSDSLRLFTTSRRRDNYTSLLGDVESLREANKGFENLLNYGMGPWAQLFLRTSWQFRNVELLSFGTEAAKRQRKRNDQLGDHTLEVVMARRRLHGRLALNYNTLQQRYDLVTGAVQSPFSQYTAFVTPDNNSNRLQLLAEFNSPVGRRDSLAFYASISRFQYDTPDTNNFDDRDELRINSQVTFGRKFSPALHFEVQASASLYHMVYIFGERSADNNWNRILRLRPVLGYTPSSRLQWHNAFEVLANYVDYDFDNLAVQTKSFVFRKFAWDDSLSWAPSRRSTFKLDYRLQLEENGQLYWADWKERVLTTRASHWLQLRVLFAAAPALSLGPGYGFYSRREWRHDIDALGNALVTPSQKFSSHGPALSIYYTPSHRARFVLDGQRRRVYPWQQRRYTINTLDLRLDWFF
ncbi:MAG TPA: hypothetical protein PLG50_05715 [bacterium]|nr:hypothetical protein [bacterium]HQG45134.1 hypothetical protein [bacterium]HQJ64215.1 hypothetical protein [bacterium]